jgi:hypothetical protein
MNMAIVRQEKLTTGLLGGEFAPFPHGAIEYHL